MHKLSVGQIVCTLLLLTGCALFQDEEVIYLKAAKEKQATQADIKRRFGAPKFLDPYRTAKAFGDMRFGLLPAEISMVQEGATAISMICVLIKTTFCATGLTELADVIPFRLSRKGIRDWLS